MSKRNALWYAPALIGSIAHAVDSMRGTLCAEHKDFDTHTWRSVTAILLLMFTTTPRPHPVPVASL